MIPQGLLEPFVILTAALLGGFCSSAPLGAINLWISDAILAGRESRLRWFLVGVIAMDCVHASIAAWGYHTYFDEGTVGRLLTVAGGAFVVILGSVSLLKCAKSHHAHPTGPRDIGTKPLNDFLFGSFMCGANPAFLMFWVFVIGQVEQRASTDISGWRLGLFLTGICVGDSVWFFLLRKVVRRGRNAFKPRLLASLRTTIAAGFVLAGGVAVYHGIRLH